MLVSGAVAGQNSGRSEFPGVSVLTCLSSLPWLTLLLILGPATITNPGERERSLPDDDEDDLLAVGRGSAVGRGRSSGVGRCADAGGVGRDSALGRGEVRVYCGDGSPTADRPRGWSRSVLVVHLRRKAIVRAAQDLGDRREQSPARRPTDGAHAHLHRSEDRPGGPLRRHRIPRLSRRGMGDAFAEHGPGRTRRSWRRSRRSTPRCRSPRPGKPVLHWAKGGVASFDDFAPQETPLKPGAKVHLQPGDGRSSNQVLPFFNVATPGGGVVLAVGWSGEWAADFSCDPRGVTLKAGMARTHLRAAPGRIDPHAADAAGVLRARPLARAEPPAAGHLEPLSAEAQRAAAGGADHVGHLGRLALRRTPG